MSKAKSFYLAFLGLMILLAATAGLSFLDMGTWNGVVAFGIAFLKALLVLVFFMELKWSSTLVRVFCFAAVIWLGILIVGTMHDYLTRTLLPFPLW
jgi:cytochrome c oxidase subunit 4